MRGEVSPTGRARNLMTGKWRGKIRIHVIDTDKILKGANVNETNKSSIAGSLVPELLHLHKRTVNYISHEKTPD